MPEEIGQPAVPAEGQPQAQTFDVGNYVNTDGTFKENWKEGFVPEDLRAEKVYDTVKNLPEAFKMLGHQSKLVGRKGVLIPTETSGESEWESYYEAIGRPKTPQDYQYEVPEDISTEDLSPEFMNAAFTRLHKRGASQQVVKEMMDIYTEHLREVEKLVDEEEQREKFEAEKMLKDKWGVEYPERLDLANRMVGDNSPDYEYQQHILEVMGNDPIVVDFLANIGSKFVEHRVIDVETPAASADNRIKELMASPAYNNRLDPDHQTVVQQVQALFAQQAQRKQKVGIT